MIWQVGDRVTLMTSSIPMTVEKVNGDQVTCAWHNAKGKLERNTVAARALKKFERRRAISAHQIFGR
jgi:uncharacterized protein YodC (DUF2158 family)